MTTMIIVPPVVLFLDDGVNVFTSVIEAERSLEVRDVRDHPEWQGFDSKFCGLRLDIISHERKLFGFFPLKKDCVKLRIDQSRSLDAASDTLKEQMRDYLFGVNAEERQTEKSQLSAREMLDQIFKKNASKA